MREHITCHISINIHNADTKRKGSRNADSTNVMFVLSIASKNSNLEKTTLDIVAKYLWMGTVDGI